MDDLTIGMRFDLVQAESFLLTLCLSLENLSSHCISVLYGGIQAEMFIGLLLRTMKSDVNLKRVAAFSKRLLQVNYLFILPGRSSICQYLFVAVPSSPY